jgi:hypothetical protein
MGARTRSGLENGATTDGTTTPWSDERLVIGRPALVVAGPAAAAVAVIAQIFTMGERIVAVSADVAVDWPDAG